MVTHNHKLQPIKSTNSNNSHSKYPTFVKIKSHEFWHCENCKGLIIHPFIILSIFPVILDLTTIRILLLGFPVLGFVSFFSPLFLSTGREEAGKPKYQTIILKVGYFLPAPIYSAICLNIIYFLRRNKKNLIAGFFCTLISYVLICVYLINVGQQEKVTLFLIPFAFLILFSFSSCHSSCLAYLYNEK